MDIKAIEQIAKNAKYFSGVIQIVENEDVRLNIASGYAKREDTLLNNTDTAFGIASGTKGFTALGILRLVNKGKLQLDDPIFEILPLEFPNMNNDITVRQLLNHTSGIYDYFDEEIVEDFGLLFEKVPVHKILGPQDMFPLLVEGQAYFKPGERFKYCNSGFVILGILIEAVSGKDYATYIQEEVCNPLGLSRTGCYKSNQLPKNCALGYLQDDVGNWYSNIYEIPIVCTADGGLFTTADDMKKMWHGITSNNFLDERIQIEMFSTQVAIDVNLHYGLGFWIKMGKEGKQSYYYLVGEDPGVSFVSQYHIGKKQIVTILGNTSEAAEILLKDISTYL